MAPSWPRLAVPRTVNPRVCLRSGVKPLHGLPAVTGPAREKRSLFLRHIRAEVQRKELQFLSSRLCGVHNEASPVLAQWHLYSDKVAAIAAIKTANWIVFTWSRFPVLFRLFTPHGRGDIDRPSPNWLTVVGVFFLCVCFWDGKTGVSRHDQGVYLTKDRCSVKVVVFHSPPPYTKWSSSMGHLLTQSGCLS